MRLRDAISSLAQGGPFTVTRTAEGAFDDAGVYASGPTALVVADDVIESTDAIADTFTLTAHGLRTGDGPIRLTTDDTLPAGLALLTDYWVIRIDANTIQLAESLEDAMAVLPIPITVTDGGIGVHTISDTTTTKRQNRTTFAIVASVQPVTGRMLMDLPESQRADETRVVYTETELRTRMNGNDPDVVTLDAEPWTVVKVERFDAFGGTHYRAYVARTENP